jgi:hypothetical protein
MSIKNPTGGVVKPFFNARQTALKAKAAQSLHEGRNALIQGERERESGYQNGLRESTFTTIKSKAVQRREANVARKNAFLESLTEMVAQIAYRAMPVDNKADVMSGGAAFANMKAAASSYLTKDPAISMKVGDLYARSSVLNLGETETVSASQMAIGLASSCNPFGAPTVIGTNVKMSDNPDQATYNTQNYLDNLLSFGDIAKGQDKEQGNISEAAYKAFVDTCADKVEGIVLGVLKEETDIIDLQTYLAEDATANKFSKHANRELYRQATGSSVLREVAKTISVMSESIEYRPEMLMSEAIAQYSLMETLSVLGFMTKGKEELIRECFDARRQKRLSMR